MAGVFKIGSDVCFNLNRSSTMRVNEPKLAMIKTGEAMERDFKNVRHLHVQKILIN